EVIAVTDHYQVRTGAALIAAARSAGIRVFPGFEAKTKDGVHLLCLFDPNRQAEAVERVIGQCGIQDGWSGSPSGSHDTLELLEHARNWTVVCIAAHVDLARGGLLGSLAGQPRINAWRSPHLLACSLAGPVSGVAENLRAILENRDP